MTYEARDNSGAMFRNAEKKNPRGPDWSGKVMVNGQPMFIDAWIKQGKKGEFLSLSLKNRQTTQADDDIPF